MLTSLRYFRRMTIFGGVGFGQFIGPIMDLVSDTRLKPSQLPSKFVRSAETKDPGVLAGTCKIWVASRPSRYAFGQRNASWRVHSDVNQGSMNKLSKAVLDLIIQLVCWSVG